MTRVGVFAAGLVEQFGDVQRGAGEHGRDLAHHVRHVAVGDADARGLGRTRQHDFREVDAVLDVAVLEVVLDGVGHHDRAVVFGFVGRGAEVRQRDDLGVILERVGREVADVALQAGVVERGDDGLFVDDRRAREIQDDAVLAHELEARFVDEAAGLGRRAERARR